MASVKRVKTNTPCIYKNESTGKYDVKFNYTVFDAVSASPIYKSKWVTGLRTIGEAKAKLSELRSGGLVPDDKPVTLRTAFELWKHQRTAMSNISPVSIRNTTQHMQIISKFISLDIPVRNITPDMYVKFCSDIKAYGYAQSTLHSVNATFRKLINLCVKNKLVHENILDYVENMKTIPKDSSSYRLISKEEFEMLDAYFRDNQFIRLGVDAYPKYRLILNVLYYTGCRIGEVLALTPNDIDFDNRRIHITKAYVSDFKLTKSPKNLKHRSVPVPNVLYNILIKYFNTYPPQECDSRIFDMTHSAVSMMLSKTGEKLGIDGVTCHTFRHTYISNLILNSVPLPVIESVSGDTQHVILKTYSHYFETSDMLVANVLDNL